jgi:hypothetical protein
MGQFPNPSTQFSSTNQPPIPGGVNKKGSRHLSSVIQELMDDDNFELKLKDGKTLQGRPSKRLVEVMYALAVSGNTKAADWIAKYGYGTKQTIEFEGNPIEKILDKYGLNGDDMTKSDIEKTQENVKKDEKSEEMAENDQKEPDSIPLRPEPNPTGKFKN